jgi:hypothetical protein
MKKTSTTVKQAAEDLKRRLGDIEGVKTSLYKQEMDIKSAYFELLVQDAIRSGLFNEASWTICSDERLYLVSQDCDHKKLVERLGPIFGGWGHGRVNLQAGVELCLDDGQLTLKESNDRWKNPKYKGSPSLINFVKNNKLHVIIGDRAEAEEKGLKDKLASFEKMRELVKSMSAPK